MDINHKDIEKAIKKGKSLTEVIRISNIVEVYGSVAKFKKFVRGLSKEDMKVIEDFAKIIVNYSTIKRLHDKYIKK